MAHQPEAYWQSGGMAWISDSESHGGFFFAGSSSAGRV
jgi:hypothetical protein